MCHKRCWGGFVLGWGGIVWGDWDGLALNESCLTLLSGAPYSSSKDFVSPHTSFPLLFFFANLLILIWPLAWPFFLFRVDTWQLLHQNYSPTPDYELRALLFVIFRRYGGGFNFWFQVHRWVPLVSKGFLPLGHLPYVLIRHEKSEVRNCKQIPWSKSCDHSDRYHYDIVLTWPGVSIWNLGNSTNSMNQSYKNPRKYLLELN